ncbi:rhodanese-like domain-containing protein [Sediminibacillus halophilus]|uniref:Rhodanese-related sulfurtransferase n=1 Tax=Sediminibacillus halophilus TaxID=482461 RepID=A0A1G9QML6_9BACI|nr:rhodanese-like domain-containing protein [Sediminibacillus halophilus]SDM12061.1 Rhodanese-related sulfurtransferase [Sediminibacillus halophilus]
MDSIKEITSAELQEMLEQGENISLIDVREEEEVANGMIEGAVHIPLQEIPEAVESLDKQMEYVLICHSGMRSMNAAIFMQEEGFVVRNLVGGMMKWDGELII